MQVTLALWALIHPEIYKIMCKSKRRRKNKSRETQSEKTFDINNFILSFICFSLGIYATIFSSKGSQSFNLRINCLYFESVLSWEKIDFLVFVSGMSIVLLCFIGIPGVVSPFFLIFKRVFLRSATESVPKIKEKNEFIEEEKEQFKK